MAAHELYERLYEGDVRADLRVNRNRYTLEVFGEHTLAGAVQVAPFDAPASVEASAWADAQVNRRPVTEAWQRVLECPVCRRREVLIRHVPEQDAWEVECPDCGTFTASGPAFVVLGDTYFNDVSGHEVLRDLSYHLRARTDPAVTYSVTAENWETLARAGRQQRGRTGS